MADDAWKDAKRLYARGRIVSCTVINHQPFGVFVDLPNTSFPGLIKIPNIRDGEGTTSADYPAIGVVLRAAVLGHDEHSHQISLGLRSTQLDAAPLVERGELPHFPS